MEWSSCLHPSHRVSWPALTQSLSQGRGRWPEYPGKLPMICPGWTQLPEFNLISSTQPRISEGWNRGVERLPPLPPQRSPALWPDVFACLTHPVLPLVALKTLHPKCFVLGRNWWESRVHPVEKQEQDIEGESQAPKDHAADQETIAAPSLENRTD